MKTQRQSHKSGSPVLKGLREYLVNKMFPGQVGFVPECGVLMNLVRAVNLIVDYTVKMFMACSLISRMLTIW